MKGKVAAMTELADNFEESRIHKGSAKSRRFRHIIDL